MKMEDNWGDLIEVWVTEDAVVVKVADRFSLTGPKSAESVLTAPLARRLAKALKKAARKAES